jgi:hypothetical protein
VCIQLGGSLSEARKIGAYRPIIAAAEKEMPLIEAHMEMTQGYPAGSLPGGTAEDLREATHGQIYQ